MFVNMLIMVVCFLLGSVLFSKRSEIKSATKLKAVNMLLPVIAFIGLLAGVKVVFAVTGIVFKVLLSLISLAFGVATVLLLLSLCGVVLGRHHSKKD